MYDNFGSHSRNAQSLSGDILFRNICINVQ